MIHKIEIYPHYTYPSKPTATINEHSNFKPAYSTLQHSAAKTCSNLDLSSSCLQPYRTVSHYGFNYPLTYMPNVKLQPTFLTTPIELQRQKVISFIRKFNMEAQQHERKQRQQQLDLQKLKALHNKLPVQQPELDLDEVIYQNIIPNSKNQASIPSLATLETTSSFISVREIQLNNRTSGQSGVTPSIRQRQLSCSNSQHSKTDQEHDENQAHEQHHHHHHHHHDSNDLLQSEQFSSLLSISGSYPNPSHHSHDHFTTDSGDNCSSVETQRTKNYLERHFLPIQSAADDKLRNRRADNYDEDHDPHKPECEQQAQHQHQHHESLPNLKDTSDYHNQKHITLTLNSLKRRASSLSASIKEKPARNTLRSKSKTKLLSSLPLAENSCDNSQSSCGESSSASTTAIEIHINVTIRNNDCIKNLRNHENEFKTKLEKVIDDEINIITRELELEEQPQTIRQEITEQCRATTQHENEFNEDIDDLLMLKHLNPTQRCLSAPDSIYLYSREKHSAEHQHDFYSERDSSYCAEADRQHYKADAKHMLQDQHHSNASIPFHDINFVGCGSNNFPNLNSLRYRHTLTLLEHELEMLLNGIIRNMCDCKSKITQISDEIRTATLHVGSLNPNGSNSNTTASNSGSLLNSKIQSKSVKQQRKDIGENVQNGDHSEAHLSTFSHSSKEDISTDGSPKKDKKKKKGLRTPSFLKKKKEKKKAEA